MHGHVVHAPLRKPTRLLDIGCGTGIQTRELGSTFPSASVYGVDLSPVPNRQKPANVDFVQGNIRDLIQKDSRFVTGSVDYVFSRLLILGMTDWQSYVKDVAALLKPGGWAEMQDFDLDWYLHGELCSDQWQWLAALRNQARKTDWDLSCGSNIKTYMEKAGLVNVTQKPYRLPLGTWMAEREGKPETRRIGEHSAREYGMLYHHGIPKMLEGAGYSDEEIKVFQAESKKCLAAEDGKDMVFFVTVGKKPEI